MGDTNEELIYELIDSVEDIEEDDYKKEFRSLVETYYGDNYYE